MGKVRFYTYFGLVFAGVLSLFGSPVRARIFGDNPACTYTVSDEAPTLGEIAVLLYGNASYAKKIAYWNGIAPPYLIYPGQELNLNITPIITPTEGKEKLLAMWRKCLGMSDSPTRPVGQSPMDTNAQSAFLKTLKSQGFLEENSKNEDLQTGKEELKEGHYQQAIPSLEKSLSQNPDNVETYFYEIQAYVLNKQTDLAKNAARELIHRHPKLKDLPFLIRILSESGGDP